MNQSELPKPILIALPDGLSNETPTVTHVSYDLWSLQISLKFREDPALLYVNFPSVACFRVMDEGNLCELWEPGVRPKAWLIEVESGGWRDLERTRWSFTTGHLEWLKEYLVVGQDDCISVISAEPPVVQRLGSNKSFQPTAYRCG